MPSFNPNRLHYENYNDVSSLIKSGWVAQYRGWSYVSQAIAYSTGGCHSHSAMLRRDDASTLDVLELRTGCGGRAVPFEDEVRKESGCIDIFAPDLQHFPEFDGDSAARYMRHLTARSYGWRGAARLGLMRCPLLWRLWPLTTEDEDSDGKTLLASNDAPFCSHAVSAACRIGGGVDPVPRKPDWLTVPNDLTRSLLFVYAFTVYMPGVPQRG